MTKWTEAHRIDNPKVQPPLFYFNFREFEDIGSTITGSRIVVDIIGRIKGVGPIESVNTLNGPTDIRNILVENIRGKALRITLWTTFVSMIDEIIVSDASHHSPIVYAFSSLELGTFNREHFLKTYSATKIYSDQSQPHIAEYMQLFTRESCSVSMLQPRIFHSSKPSKFSTPIDISLEDLIKLEPYSNKDQQFSCLATIDGIINEDSWSYSACPECKVSTYCSEDPIACHKCQTLFRSTIQWYRLVLRVANEVAMSQFTAMGKQAEHIVKKKADVVFAESRQTGKMIPPSLEDIYGKSFLFTVEINVNQLHRQRISFNINKVQTAPGTHSFSPQTHMLPPIIHEDHYSTTTPSSIYTPKRISDHTGLSPQAAHLLISSPTDNSVSSHSSGTKRKISLPPNHENGTSSASHSADDVNSNAATIADISIVPL